MTDPVKTKILELCPDLMELKFGCVVKDFLKGTGIILTVHEYAGESNTYDVFYNLIPDPHVYQSPRGNWDIIGSPITLAVVLRAILAVNAANRTNVLVEAGGLIKVCHWEGGRHLLGRAAEWDLLKDYDGQTEETKRLIRSLLGV